MNPDDPVPRRQPTGGATAAPGKPGLAFAAMRVVVLGAGFGGLELTTRLSEELGDDVDVVLIDQTDDFVFGFSKLDVMFGRTRPDGGPAPVPRPGEAGRARSCRPRSRRSTRRPSGSRPTPGRSRPTSWSSRSAPTSTPAATPGLRRGRPRVLHGGRRVRAARRARRASRAAGSIVGVTSTAVQVPAGAERDRADDARLPRPTRGSASSPRSRWSCRCRCRSRRHRRRRRCSSRPSPSAASTWHAEQRRAARSTRRARWRSSATTPSCPYDLFLGVPVHRAPAVVVEVRAHRRRLDPGRPADARDLVPRRLRGRRRHQRRHAEGRRVRRGAGRGGRRRDHRPGPRDGRRLRVRRPRDLLPRVRRRRRSPRSTCSSSRASRRRAPSRPASEALAADKAEFGRSRIQRWFGRDWPHRPAWSTSRS